MTERGIRLRWAGIAVTAFVGLMTLEVLGEDEPMGIVDVMGDALQMALIVVSATGTSLLASRFQAERDEKARLLEDLEIARTEGAVWRAQAEGYVSGLGEAIEAQFDEWQLTPAEAEVGLLMLKGLSHREVAALRGTSEATVRHQARSIYLKSNLPGRGAFCAYFLEDLLPPAAESA